MWKTEYFGLKLGQDLGIRAGCERQTTELLQSRSHNRLLPLSRPCNGHFTGSFLGLKFDSTEIICINLIGPCGRQQCSYPWGHDTLGNLRCWGGGVLGPKIPGVRGLRDQNLFRGYKREQRTKRLPFSYSGTSIQRSAKGLGKLVRCIEVLFHTF